MPIYNPPTVSTAGTSGKHTDLTAKEVAGILDHADDSVNLAKLAHGTANYLIGFDGTGVPTELASAPPGSHTLDSHSDVPAITEAQGQILYWDGSNWVALAVSTAGYILKTQGAGANPAWTDTSPKALDLTIGSQAQGDILYFNGTNWVRLAAGTDGQYLETNGAAANPAWSDVSAGIVPSRKQYFILLNDFVSAYLSTNTSGTGVATLGTDYVSIDSGATSGGKAQFSNNQFKDNMTVTNNPEMSIMIAAAGVASHPVFIGFYDEWNSNISTSTVIKAGVYWNGTTTVIKTSDGTTESDSAAIGQWTSMDRIEIRLASGTVSVYYNGVLKGTKTTNIPPDATNMQAGAWTASTAAGANTYTFRFMQVMWNA